MSHTIAPLNPPHRLLMAPGPVNVDPRVLQAMSKPTVGQFDPYMFKVMGEVQEMLRTIFKTENKQTMVVDGTSRSAIEAAFVSVLAPGDPVLVCCAGRFGLLLKEIAERCGADVHAIEKPWGEVFSIEEITQAIESVKPKLVATVHGDTSTTMRQPLEGLGEICHRNGALLYTDSTAALLGNDLRADEWGIDIVTTGMQKCFGGPSGMAPITVSERAVAVMEQRKSIEAGVADSQDEISGSRIHSNYFDLPQIFDYWGPRHLNHHTEATHMLYAVHEACRLVVEEGVDAVIERHRLNGAAMAAAVQGMGLSLYGDQANRMNDVIGVKIPAGADDVAVRGQLLGDFGVEIASSFGPLKGTIWRIGVMGANARKDAVLTAAAALGSVLERQGVAVNTEKGIEAALAVYGA
ncbi:MULTISPECIES: pyridoxal-phosphate-dependent aminotransferase family protein [Bifidobacterium]|jgi:(S)-ureidoglycine-glyoxylate aminotransferase|uniref:Alanine--glyoxylate aminotransferase family protein n=1 Tax=Bifidobacterium tibiigranuli TaxID=2172043 RepID=A0A5N6S5M8_9BIFI|nr:alanine--glyoxylate aminotransferase family protein [Bifidobacterium tibiigranuli]KAE8129558.1 alanine--glyoxylate aminotransferase family protein [Bifidobacterium tibiigranuli]KAE8129922.1 aminotransferase [Bifidobacterium tibiigranuli]MCH3975725.1 alanine--glyoxylate aminotransferase family protein [Bifidobacterium tibiigranuli]MCH4189856.1 alanine--glyoxylate aminotransferase family protein [Bifidobacterium tibiigranuli]MCH4203010.1 alanine--glyoxylate aminotransferase family protein [Bi